MNSHNPEHLYALLPAHYRQRDLETGEEPLRALMALAEEGFRAVQQDILSLYGNWFIETCEEWVIPYLGDLLGIRDLGEEKNVVTSQRARVANTVSYRRRKGIAAALSHLVSDVTGWKATVVEQYQNLQRTQNLNHSRLGQAKNLDLRQMDGLHPLGSPFDKSAHGVDVRGSSARRTNYNIPNLGLFLWRLQSYPITASTAAPAENVAKGRFSFSSLDHPVALFNRPQIETNLSRPIEEINLPAPLTRKALQRDLEDYAQSHAEIPEEHRPPNSRVYGPDRSFQIVKDGEPIPPWKIVGADLSDWPAFLEETPPGKILVAVDPELGRMVFPENSVSEAVKVSYNYGFSADIGGGPYDRRHTLAKIEANTKVFEVSKNPERIKAGAKETLQQARDAWDGKGHCLIRIMDNGIYGGRLKVELPEGSRLTIEAADGMRPCIRLADNLKILPPSQGKAAITLNGVIIEGAIKIGEERAAEIGEGGSLTLQLIHSTVVPGGRLDQKGLAFASDWDLVKADAGTKNLQVTVSHCIVGPIRLPQECEFLKISDSIVAAPGTATGPRPAIAGSEPELRGPPTSLERCTVLGAVNVKEMPLASEVIFTVPVTVLNRQVGGVRYSYIPPDSKTPRRFRCQPDLALYERATELEVDDARALPPSEKALTLARLKPRFTSEHYDHPGYAQLSQACPEELRTGAGDGSEMGVFEHLKQPQRESNLRLILEEYLRFGMEAGISYVT